MADISDVEAQELSVLLEEFKSIRQEISSRSSTQASLLSLNVTAIGAVAGLYFSAKDPDARIFLLIPLISSILGLLYADHALNIGKLAKFVRWQIKPRIARCAHLPRLADYEVYANNYIAPRRTYGQVLPVAIIAMFIAIPLAALVLPFTTLLGGKKELLLNLGNLALAAPGVILLLWFLFIYQSVHYGGKSEANKSPQGLVEVKDSDFMT